MFLQISDGALHFAFHSNYSNPFVNHKWWIGGIQFPHPRPSFLLIDNAFSVQPMREKRKVVQLPEICFSHSLIHWLTDSQTNAKTKQNMSITSKTGRHQPPNNLLPSDIITNSECLFTKQSWCLKCQWCLSYSRQRYFNNWSMKMELQQLHGTSLPHSGCQPLASFDQLGSTRALLWRSCHRRRRGRRRPRWHGERSDNSICQTCYNNDRNEMKTTSKTARRSSHFHTLKKSPQCRWDNQAS